MRYITRSMQGGIFTHRATSPYQICYQNLPEDMDDWNCAHWDAYKDCNIGFMGIDAARTQVAKDSGAISMFADGHDCRYDCDWVRRWESQGFDTGSNIFSKAYCAGENVTGGVEGVTRTLSSLFKPKVLIPLGALALGIVGYNKGWFDFNR